MKHQRTKTSTKNLVWLAMLVVTLVAMIGCFTVLASAKEVAELKPNEDFFIDLDYSDGIPTKEYDGTVMAPVRLSEEKLDELNGMVVIAHDHLVKLSCEAVYDSAGVDATKITVTVKMVPAVDTPEAIAAAESYEDIMPAPQTIPAKIVPKTLNWVYGNPEGTLFSDVEYVMGQSDYTVDLTPDLLPALDVTDAPALLGDSFDVSFSGVAASTETASYTATVNVSVDSPNYVAAPLSVTLRVSPIEIVEIEWEKFWDYSQYVFTWGDANIEDICATGKTADGTEYPLQITFPAGYGNVGTHTVTASATAGLALKDGLANTMSVTVHKRVFTVMMNGASHFGSEDMQTTPTVHSLTVETVDEDDVIPAEIRALIAYSNNNQSAFGTYEITAELPISSNYEFRDADGNVVTSLSATMYIKRSFLVAESKDIPYQVILYRPDGFLDDIRASVTVPNDLSKKALSDFPVYKAYNLAITGGATESFTVTIPLSTDLYHKRCNALSINDLYLYDSNSGKLTPAVDITGYTVTLTDSAYQIEGVKGSSNLTFVIAPVFNAPFWGSIWSILLTIFVILAVIALMLLVGLYLLRIRLSETQGMVIDTDGDVPEIVDPVIEDKVDVEEALDDKLDDLANSVMPEEPTETEDTEGVEEAVAEALEENFEDDGTAIAAIAVVADDDDEDEGEDDSFGGFGDLSLDFFDAKEEADRYALLLEEENRGETRIVTRYRRSFQSRLAQSQGNVQEYYSAIKNALLSYKGVKSRTSWNYEAFNRGRAHVAKLNAKTKTLYLYLALDPAELADTKYGITDMSSKKKYASVPVLLKIKGERKFKYALELIEKLCAEDMALQKLDVAEIDYKPAYQTTEELVEAGLVKKMVAGVPIVYGEQPVSEEPVEPVTAATEDQEVSFVEPTDDPAVAAAAQDDATENV
ncbi:MAG: hypothetical protein E7637_08390 [Ruminococcaceae bacterium]|nr:hypothetical protein [Oscillospiraceae bacterium]